RVPLVRVRWQHVPYGIYGAVAGGVWPDRRNRLRRAGRVDAREGELATGGNGQLDLVAAVAFEPRTGRADRPGCGAWVRVDRRRLRGEVRLCTECFGPRLRAHVGPSRCGPAGIF